MKTCAIEGCDRNETNSKMYSNYCNKHYLQIRKYGQTKPEKPKTGICKVEGCDKKAFYGHNYYCTRHWNQYKNNGFVYNYNIRDQNISHIYADDCFIELKDRYGNTNAVTVIDSKNESNVLQYKWFLSKRGYVVSRINRKLIYLHKFITGYGITDHINRDKLDNRIKNLRQSDNSTNALNKNPVCGTSDHRGVWFDAKNKKYCAMITTKTQRYWGGRYNSEIDAAIAYNELSRKYHGEFGVLNET